MFDQGLMVIKVIVFIFIVLSPFINYKYVEFMNMLGFKVALLAVIVVACFVDLQLAILLTLAMLLLVINLNMKKHETFENAAPPAIMTVFPEERSSVCHEVKEVEGNMNDHMYNLYIDPKIKPFEEFIHQLSPSELVEAASNSKKVEY
jgi:hypothetical protein